MNLQTQAGLTLLEVVLALLIIAIGVLAAFSLQSAALSASGSGQAIQEATKIAEAEIEMRRRTQLSPGTSGCVASAAGDFACTVEVIACELLSGDLSCSSSLAESSAVAYRVSVQVVGPRNKDVALNTVVAK